jgi:hypothetical protein
LWYYFDKVNALKIRYTDGFIIDLVLPDVAAEKQTPI